MPSLSPSWAWPVAGLLIAVAGCAARPADDRARLAERAARMMDDLSRLEPRLAKAGTPVAEELLTHLAAVREGLLAPAPTAAAQPEAVSAPTPAAVRCPDAGCWRLGVQTEVGLWRLQLRGGGEVIHDTGPAAVGLAVALERARPIDRWLEWSWGGEAVAAIQDRLAGQHVTLLGVRPVLRAALAVTDRLAVTARPLLEVGQAQVRLGSGPGGVLHGADVYGAIGVRAGLRLRSGNAGDLTAEAGWRQAWFNTSTGPISYRVSIISPELAVGWSWRW